MDVMRQRLRRIIERYGEGILKDQGKAEDLIRDLCGQDQERIELLIAALKTGLVDEIVRWRGQAEPIRYLPRLARSLELRGASPQGALWATGAWGVALGVLEEEAADRLEIVTPQPVVVARSPKPLPTGPPSDHGGFARYAGLIARIGGAAMMLLFCLWPLHCVNALFKTGAANKPQREAKLNPLDERVKFVLNQQWALDKEVAAIQFSSDGRKLISFGGGAPLTAWDYASGAKLKMVRYEGYHPVALSADGSRLAIYGGENGIGILDVDSEVMLGELQEVPPPTMLAFSPDSRFLMSVGAAGRRIALWDATFMRPFLSKDWPGQARAENLAAFSPDSRRIVAAPGGGPAMDILEIGAASLDVVQTLEGSRDSVVDVCFDCQGTRVASCTADGTIRVWDAKNGSEKLRIAITPAFAVRIVFHPVLPILLTKTGEGQVRVWDTRSGKEVGRLDVSARALALSPDGSILAIQGYVASNDPKRPSQPVIKTYNLTDKGLEP